MMLDWWKAHKLELVIDLVISTVVFCGLGIWALWKLLKNRKS